MKNVAAELADLMSDQVTSLPADVQRALDEVSVKAANTYDSASARDAAWDGVPTDVLGVALLRDRAGVVTVRKPGVFADPAERWGELQQKIRRAAGSFTLDFADTAVVSDLKVISFPSGRFLNPPRVDVFYTAPAGNTRVVQARVIPGTITATGCSVQAVMVGGATGASTITVQYYAEEWW